MLDKLKTVFQYLFLTKYGKVILSFIASFTFIIIYSNYDILPPNTWWISIVLFAYPIWLVISASIIAIKNLNSNK